MQKLIKQFEIFSFMEGIVYIFYSVLGDFFNYNIYILYILLMILDIKITEIFFYEVKFIGFIKLDFCQSCKLKINFCKDL